MLVFATSLTPEDKRELWNAIKKTEVGKTIDTEACRSAEFNPDYSFPVLYFP